MVTSMHTLYFYPSYVDVRELCSPSSHRNLNISFGFLTALRLNGEQVETLWDTKGENILAFFVHTMKVNGVPR